MGKLADELRERSKRDDEVIVGSEIRAALQELEEIMRDRIIHLCQCAHFSPDKTQQILKEAGLDAG